MRSSRQRQRAGFALMTTLFAITSLTFLMGTTLSRSLHDLMMADYVLATQQAFYLAETGLDDELVAQSRSFTPAQITILIDAGGQTRTLPTGTYTTDYLDDSNPNDNVVVLVSTGTATVRSGTVSKTLRTTIQLPQGGSGLFDYALIGSRVNLAGNAVVGDATSRVPLYISGSSSDPLIL